jgi:uncharacterized membrane protein
MTRALSTRHLMVKLVAAGVTLVGVGFLLLALGDHDATAFANRTDS